MTTHTRRHNDGQDAVLLAWVLILGIFGILYFLAHDRLHMRAGQLVEFTIYPLLVAIFLWEMLRYKATKRNEMEAASPRPVPHVPRQKEDEYLREARKRSSVFGSVTTFLVIPSIGAMTRAPCSRMPLA